MIHSVVIRARTKGITSPKLNGMAQLVRPSRSGSGTKWKYKEQKTLDERISEASNYMEKFPDTVPVVIQKSSKSRLKDLARFKWIVPFDLTVAQFICILRDRLKLTQKESIFILINRTLPQSSATIGELWTRHREEDGFLYLIFREENTFG